MGLQLRFPIPHAARRGLTHALPFRLARGGLSRQYKSYTGMVKPGRPISLDANYGRFRNSDLPSS